MRCQNCGGSLVSKRVEMPWTVQGVTIPLAVQGSVCEKCGETLYDVADVAKAEAWRDQIERRADSSIMTVEEAADYLKVTVQTIYSLVKKRRLPAARIGREWRFNRNQIDALFLVEGDRDAAGRTPRDEAAVCG